MVLDRDVLGWRSRDHLARSVIIKGTSIFDSQAGGYKDLAM